jgi:pimeloyl-ACP methyl ester carboxylesterase
MIKALSMMIQGILQSRQMKRARPVIYLPLIALLCSACALKPDKSLIKYIPRKPHTYIGEQQYIQVDGMRISYFEMGEGHPIIFVHGLAGCADNFDPVVMDLSKDYRCIVIDLPGFGNSEATHDIPYSIELYARTVAHFMDALGIEKATVVGHSMGGQTSAYLAIHYPDRLDRLVLVAAAGAGTTRWYFAVLANLPLENIALSALHHVQRKMNGKTHEERVEYLRNLPVNFIVNRLAHKHKQGEPDPFMDPTWEYYADFIMTREIEEFIHAVIMSMETITATDLSPDLHKIKTPTLLVWGAKDMAVKPEDALVFNQEIEGSMLVMAKHCYHEVQVDCADIFNHTIRAFLSTEFQ